MIFLIALLLLSDGYFREVSCRPSEMIENVKIDEKSLTRCYGDDANLIVGSSRERDTEPSITRVRRNLESSTTKPSTMKATNQTIMDYHAQRKAVMDRYYARQREIKKKFAQKIESQKTNVRTTVRPTTTTTTTGRTIFPIPTTTARMEITTDKNLDETIVKEKIVEIATSSWDERENDRRDEKNSSTSWMYRSNNWNPRIVDGDSDMDLQAESSIAVERMLLDTTERVAGYYKLGDFKGTKNEKVVYQHNLGVGVKGPSQLDATFETVIEGPYDITVVEAYPYANSRANFTWLGGGPGTDFVKLKLRGYENEGFSYSVKVWGVPRDSSR